MQSQTSCRVVATVLVLTLYIAAIGNFVSTAKSDTFSSHEVIVMDSIFAIHFILPCNLVTSNKGLAVTLELGRLQRFKLSQRSCLGSGVGLLNPYHENKLAESQPESRALNRPILYSRTMVYFMYVWLNYSKKFPICRD